MNIILTGPPGAGKGTMARFIEESYDIEIISTGEKLREEIKEGTKIGKIAKDLIEKGNFVPDSIVIDMVKALILKTPKGYLLDGFPRNVAQAVELDKMLGEINSKIDIIINIEVKDEDIIDRLKNRLVCSKCSRSYHSVYNKPKAEGKCDFCNISLEKRKDDSEEYVRKRLEIYHKETKLLIDFYSKRGLLFNIESHLENINETYEKIKKVIEER